MFLKPCIQITATPQKDNTKGTDDIELERTGPPQPDSEQRSNYSERSDCNMSTQEGEVGSVGGVPNRTWTLRYTQPLSAQQPPDYQPNVYIPGMLSGYCTLKLVPRRELN
ncbi:unnamed protein product [Oncorhynchus mykiss]|uniref:Uncharacterized protein n=1 Tax=Oncorhynchus mykiss TaxID=8022 RepID=A0A060VVV7_ONCMY|nr:unnamed protein product [Oncorhynchus mykiss]